MTVAYHRRPVLWDIDLVVPEGRLIGIVGPNGAGKTTLIKAALGLLPLASGKVEIYGLPYDQQRHLVGYVPQRETVDWDFPVTAFDVVLMGTYGRLGWFRRPGAAEKRRAKRMSRTGRTCPPMPTGKSASFPADSSSACFSPGAGAGRADLLHGRAVRRRRCGDRAGDRRAVAGSCAAGQDGAGRASRAADGASEYFDYVILLNMRLVAAGPVATTFTTENLQTTYGGRLTVLDEAAEAMRRGEVRR